MPNEPEGASKEPFSVEPPPSKVAREPAEISDADLETRAGEFVAAFPESTLSTEEARLLVAVEVDLARVVGAGVAVEVVERLPDGAVRLVATCLVEGRIGEVEAVGRGVRGAAQVLVRAAAERRLEGAFWRIVGPAG